jgi:hypothetical protein
MILSHLLLRTISCVIESPPGVTVTSGAPVKSIMSPVGSSRANWKKKDFEEEDNSNGDTRSTYWDIVDDISKLKSKKPGDDIICNASFILTSTISSESVLNFRFSRGDTRGEQLYYSIPVGPRCNDLRSNGEAMMYTSLKNTSLIYIVPTSDLQDALQSSLSNSNLLSCDINLDLASDCVYIMKNSDFSHAHTFISLQHVKVTNMGRKSKISIEKISHVEEMGKSFISTAESVSIFENEVASSYVDLDFSNRCFFFLSAHL